MTPDDIVEFLDANPQIADHAVALVVRIEGDDDDHWRLIMGGKQADGVFRHAGTAIGDLPKLVLEELQLATEGRL